MKFVLIVLVGEWVFPAAVFSRDSVEMCVCVLKVRESKFRKSEVSTSEVEGIFIGKLYINYIIEN